MEKIYLYVLRNKIVLLLYMYFPLPIRSGYQQGGYQQGPPAYYGGTQQQVGSC